MAYKCRRKDARDYHIEGNFINFRASSALFKSRKAIRIAYGKKEERYGFKDHVINIVRNDFLLARI